LAEYGERKINYFFDVLKTNKSSQGDDDSSNLDDYYLIARTGDARKDHHGKQDEYQWSARRGCEDSDE